ncbi:uncharacterized protein LOC111445885 isoform X1 [Cucurbita moschata]|uniref:Uncharacterized protein LOC111445885 isoform X1 n=1 Tax=Cucurbita moschata TaxID=3662 RepID=A0A6J1FPU5_CUCMO|nr:uncharacterized protein LOC111445885 isoform X1 [Cucurbita moschata]
MVPVVASSAHGLVCAGERFLASSQLRDPAAISGSILCWSWIKPQVEVNSFPAEPTMALASCNEATYIVGGGFSGDIYLWEGSKTFVCIVSLGIISLFTDIVVGYGGSNAIIISSSVDRTCEVWSLWETIKKYHNMSSREVVEMGKYTLLRSMLKAHPAVIVDCIFSAHCQIRGKAPVKPNKKSPYYTSLVGFTDWRRDLDLSIQPHDKFRYYGGLTMMAAKIAYESEPFVQSVVNDRWKMKFLGFFDFWNDFQNRATTQAFMFQNTATNDPNIIVIAFRGTSPFDTYDWQVDTDLSWYNIEGVGHIHSGFMKALGLQKATGWPKELTKPQHDFAYYTLRQKLRDIVKSNDKARFIITGHSLGGALATLFVTMLSYHEEKTILKKLQGVYTYGQPRVGDRQFAEFMMVKEQPNKNYFSLQWVIPKYLTALWEIIRSFITPLVWGFDYYESLLMIGARLVGLLVPGFAAHFPVNYVNSTRLGKLTASNEVDDPIHEDDIESDD